MSKIVIVLAILCQGLLGADPAPYDPAFVWNLGKDVPGVIEGGVILLYEGAPATSNPNCWNLVQNAVNQWSSLPGCRVRFKLMGPATGAFGTQVTIGWYPANNFGPNALGSSTSAPDFANKPYFNTYLNDGLDWSDPRMTEVILHELGHGLGLIHSTDPASLMYPVFTSQASITPDVYQTIRSLYGDPGYVPVPPSIAILASPTTGAAPLSTGFSIVGTAGASYSWDFGDGTSSAAPGPSHTFVAGGTFSVVVTMTGYDGQQATASASIVVLFPEARNTAGRARLSLDFKRNTGRLSFSLSCQGMDPRDLVLDVSIAGQAFPTSSFKNGRNKGSLKLSDPKLLAAMATVGAVNDNVHASVLIPYSIVATPSGSIQHPYECLGTLTLSYAGTKGVRGTGK